MCDVCGAKAAKIDSLATYFRAKARETVMRRYIVKMYQTAATLDDLSKHLRQRCRCNDVEQQPIANQDAPRYFISNFNW